MPTNRKDEEIFEKLQCPECGSKEVSIAYNVRAHLHTNTDGELCEVQVFVDETHFTGTVRCLNRGCSHLWPCEKEPEIARDSDWPVWTTV